MKVYAHYDTEADVAWFLFDDVRTAGVVSEQAEWGLRDYDRETGALVGLEFWRASEQLPKELLEALPEPQLDGMTVTRRELRAAEHAGS